MSSLYGFFGLDAGASLANCFIQGLARVPLKQRWSNVPILIHVLNEADWDIGILDGGAVAGHKLVHEAPRTCLTILCEHKLWTDSDIRKQSFRISTCQLDICQYLPALCHGTTPEYSPRLESHHNSESKFNLKQDWWWRSSNLFRAHQKKQLQQKNLYHPHWSTNNSPSFVLIYLYVPNLCSPSLDGGHQNPPTPNPPRTPTREAILETTMILDG